MEIYDILQELNKSNSSNYKISVLQKYKDNKLFQKVLAMTYDTVKYNYGVGKTSLEKIHVQPQTNKYNLEQALQIFENEFVTRKVTGNEALKRLEEVYNGLNDEDRYVFTRVIERDLKTNIGAQQINKVFKNLITKPVYCRCDVYNPKTLKIKFPAFVQLKADGLCCFTKVEQDKVTCYTRSGEEFIIEKFQFLKNIPELEGITLQGELVIDGQNRALGNGKINSLIKYRQNKNASLTESEAQEIENEITYYVWDFLTQEDIGKAIEKKKDGTTYKNRFEKLQNVIKKINNDQIKLIPSKVVNNLSEALQYTSELMNNGYEGSILKDFRAIFINGTSKLQIKLKLEISAEMRCIGFKEGTKGTKREGKIGAILFANDEGTIKGSCSGFTDEELDYFTEHQDELIGKVFEVKFNDVTKAEGNDYFALSHPRFVEWRNDKDETDTLEKVLKLKEMAMNLK